MNQIISRIGDVRKLPIIYGVLLLIALIITIFLWNVVSKVFNYLLTEPLLWGIFLGGAIVFFVLHKKYPKEFTLLEMGLCSLASFPAIFLCLSIFFVTNTDLSDTEYLNSYVVKTVHIEDYYTERSEQKCSTCYDDKGNSYDCNCYTVYHCDVYHPDQYYIVNGIGTTISVSSSEYANIRNRFGTGELQVASSQFGQCSGDGREFEVRWDNEWETMLPTSQPHLYINYVKATNTLHKITGQKGNEKLIVPYPQLYNKGFGDFELDRVLTAGVSLPPAWKDSIDILTSRYLSTLAPKRQCNILYYFVNDEQSFYNLLQQEWINGKKNDIVVIVGMQKWPNIKWVRIMSWAKYSQFNIELRDNILAMKQMPSASTFVNTVVMQVDRKGNGGFIRQPMEEYSYLLKEVHLGWGSWIAIIIIVTIMIFPLLIYFFGTDEFKVQ